MSELSSSGAATVCAPQGHDGLIASIAVDVAVHLIAVGPDLNLAWHFRCRVALPVIRPTARADERDAFMKSDGTLTPQIAAGIDAFSQSTPLRSTAGDLEPPLVATSTIAPTAQGQDRYRKECPLGAPAQNARPSLGGIGTSRGPEARSLR